jgi:phage FluMu protein Com
MLTLEQVRCPVCNRRLVDMNGQAQIRCPKCKSLVAIDTVARKVNILERQEKSANYPTKKVG